MAAPALRAIALRAFRIPRPPLAFRLVGPVRLRLTSAACAGRPPPQRRPDARNRRRLRRPASVRKGISSPRTPHLCQDGKPPFLRFSTPRYAEPLPLPRPSSDKPRHSPSDDGGSTASFHLRWPPLRAKHGCSHRAFGYVFTAAPRTPLCGRLTVPPSSLSALRALRSERAAVCPASKVSPPLGTPLCQKREPAVLYFPFDKLTEPSALNRASHWFMGFSLPVCIVPHAIQLRCDQAIAPMDRPSGTLEMIFPGRLAATPPSLSALRALRSGSAAAGPASPERSAGRPPQLPHCAAQKPLRSSAAPVTRLRSVARPPQCGQTSGRFRRGYHRPSSLQSTAGDNP